jgi:hypothetical protein
LVPAGERIEPPVGEHGSNHLVEAVGLEVNSLLSVRFTTKVPKVSQINAVDRISLLSRRTCREVFERRFTASRMAFDYLAIYKALLSDEKGCLSAVSSKPVSGGRFKTSHF